MLQAEIDIPILSRAGSGSRSKLEGSVRTERAPVYYLVEERTEEGRTRSGGD